MKKIYSFNEALAQLNLFNEALAKLNSFIHRSFSVGGLPAAIFILLANEGGLRERMTRARINFRNLENRTNK